MDSLRCVLLLCLVPSFGTTDDKLPAHALARIGDHRFYHGPGLSCAVLTPDGSYAASAAQYPDSLLQISNEERERYNRTIVLWDTATGQRIREFTAPHSPIVQLSFSSDGKLLATACADHKSANPVVVFEVRSGRLVQRVGDFKQLAYLRFSPDDKQLHVSEWLGNVSAWDVATGKRVQVWQKPPLEPATSDKEAVWAFRGIPSPDGTVIVWEMGPTFNSKANPWRRSGLLVQDATTTKTLHRKDLPLRRLMRSCVFSRDGKQFAVDADGFRVWDTRTGKPRHALDVPESRMAVPTPDGQHAVICDRTYGVRLWDLEKKKPVRQLYDGLVTLNRFTAETPQLQSANGNTLLLWTDTRLLFIDLSKGKKVSGHQFPIAPRFSTDGKTLYSCCLEKEQSWDVSSTKPALGSEKPSNRREPTKPVSDDGQYSLTWDSQSRRNSVHETATNRTVSVLEAKGLLSHTGWFSPDAKRVLLSWQAKENPEHARKQDLFWVCDVKSGKFLWEFEPKGLTTQPLFSPDGRYIAWANEKHDVCLRDAATGKLRTLHSTKALPTVEGPCEDYRVSFSPDSTQVMITLHCLIEDANRKPNPRTVPMPMRVFNVSSGKEMGRFYPNSTKTMNGDPLANTIWSPDSRLLAVTERESRTIRLIEIASGKVRREFDGHRHGVHGLDFSPDGKKLASGGEDNVAFLWDVTGALTAPAVKNVSDTLLAKWWTALADDDAAKAGDALASFIRSAERGVAGLKERLRPVAAPDAKRLSRLLADLDSSSFAKREAASRDLLQLGELAEGELRRALQAKPSLELRRRLEELLDRIETAQLSQQTLQALRAIEALEHIGTTAARQVLQTVAEGHADARPTREAKAALARLTK